MTDNATVSIPQDVLQPIIQAKVAAVLAEALGSQSSILYEAVTRVLSQRVDSEGKPSTSSYNTSTFVDYLTGKALRDAVLAAVQESMLAHKEVVRAALLKELQKKNSPFVKQLVTGMISGAFDASRIKYGVTVNVSPKD